MSTSGAPTAGEHLGLGDGGALVLGHARVEEHAGDLAGLVRLDVRPQPRGPPAISITRAMLRRMSSG